MQLAPPYWFWSASAIWVISVICWICCWDGGALLAGLPLLPL